MRHALISDIHANLEALDAVLQDIESRNVDGVVCLGDLVGYHSDPNECIERIRSREIPCVAGNHDRAAAGTKRPLHFGAKARKIIAWTGRQLSTENKDFLAELPLFHNFSPHFVAVHAALHPEPNDSVHLSTPERALRSLHWLETAGLKTNVCFFGHTHRPLAYQLRERSLEMLEGPVSELVPSAFYLINPGSVGQSRDKDLRASYAVYDSDTMTVEHHRVEYDYGACQAKCETRGLLDGPSSLQRAAYFVSDRLDQGASLPIRALRKASRTFRPKTARAYRLGGMNPIRS